MSFHGLWGMWAEWRARARLRHREALRPSHPGRGPGLRESRMGWPSKAQPQQGWELPGLFRVAAQQPTQSQIADAARDNAEGAPCGGRGICSVAPPVRPARQGQFRWTRCWVPHFSRFGEKWRPSLQARQRPGSRQHRENWGTRLSPPPPVFRESNGKPRPGGPGHIADNS
jgi:hypothetical protein